MADRPSRAVRSRAFSRPTAVDLFSGVGGLTLGFEQAGFDVVASIDYDPTHCVIHKYNFPECETVCRDIHKITASEVVNAARNGARRMRRGSDWNGIDVLIGGPSCQGFSVGGLRDPADDRNLLLNEFVRLVCEIRPRAFCLENVRGLLESRFDRLRSAALKKLRGAGYAISGDKIWHDAIDFGVPQARKRVFILGVLDGPAPEMAAPDASPFVTVGEAFEGLPEVETYPDLLDRAQVRLSRSDMKRREDVVAAYARSLSGVSTRTDLSRPRRWDEGLLTCSFRTVHSSATIRLFDATAPGSVEPKSRLFRLDVDGVSRTLRAGTGRERGAHTSPRPIHPTLPRVITVREAARLHGFPDWFRFNPTSWHGHRQIGNSVPPPLARAAGEALLDSLGARPRRPWSVKNLGRTEWCELTPSEAADLLVAKNTELPPKRARPQDSSQTNAEHETRS